MPSFSISIVNFERVNVGWAAFILYNLPIGAESQTLHTDDHFNMTYGANETHKADVK